MVDSEQLRLEKVKEEQDWRILQLPKGKSSLEKMVATAQLMLALIKGVVNVGVVIPKPILKSW